MIEKIMKAVKSGNKKRGRNITIGTVVGFLLSCTAVMGTDEYLWIKNDGSGIKFNTEKTMDKDGVDGKWETENPYEKNEWNGNTYTNNITLSSSTIDGKDKYDYEISSGLRLSGNLGNFNFINNGMIIASGTSSDENGFGYGIYIYNTAGEVAIKNEGVISGTGIGIENYNNVGYGHGIYISSTTGEVAIKNEGVINGSGSETNHNCGYGITISGTAGEVAIENEGVINGTGNGGSNSGYGYGYGIEIDTVSGGASIKNEGVISGTWTGSNSGYSYRIFISNTTVENITNIGVIYGKISAIENSFGILNNGVNYGILVNGDSSNEVVEGLTVTQGTSGQNEISNYGLIIKDGAIDGSVDTNPGSFQIEFGNGTKSMTIENKSDVNGNDSFTGNKTDYILNVLKNTYKVTGTEDEVMGSIINAYGTAVIFEGADKKLTLSGTTVNGGADGSDVVGGGGNSDTLILEDASIINGNINMGAEVDNLSLNSGVIVNGTVKMGDGNDVLDIVSGGRINGTLDGGTDNDVLNFNPAVMRASNNDEIKIFHNISGFENMNIGTNITVYEKTIGTDGKTMDDLKISDAEVINIKTEGTLTLRIDSTKTANLGGIDKIIGHALYENNGTISSEGGKLLLALNGAGNESIISFGTTTLGDGLDRKTLDTTSKLHTVEKLNNKEVAVTARWDLPNYLEYQQLNKIYQGIVSVEDLIGNFNVDNDEKLSTFLGYLNDIYAGNPYSYSSELSRKSTGMFRDIVTENIFKPEANKWIIYGGLTHVDGGTKDTYYGKGYYAYDIGSSDMDADTKITGAYMLGEYGVSDTLTSGVVIGGNKLKSDLSNGSKVDGSALYLGAYAKKYVGNLKVTAGAGFQYGDYDADRMALGRGITETRSYSSNYNDITYDIYLNGRYSHNIGDNLFLEPYGTLSYTYIDQDGADEGNQTLAIETDSKSFDYTVGKAGLDLKKVIPHEKGKSTLSAGVSYTRILDGADEKFITGRFKGGRDFDILVAHKNEHSIGVNAKYALELENGVLFDVKGTYAVERDSHNRAGKNKTKGEWIVGAGLGYKF